jgi:hypothetical protein
MRACDVFPRPTGESRGRRRSGAAKIFTAQIGTAGAQALAKDCAPGGAAPRRKPSTDGTLVIGDSRNTAQRANDFNRLVASFAIAAFDRSPERTRSFRIVRTVAFRRIVARGLEMTCALIPQANIMCDWKASK